MQWKFKSFGKKCKTKKDKKKSGAAQEFLAKLSRALMLPIAMLPIAGLFLGIGSSISSSYDAGTVGNIIGSVIAAPGNAVFGILPLLFAIAIAITFTGDAGTAGLSAVLGWFVFVAFQSALINQKVNDNGDFISASFLWYHYTGDNALAKFQASFQSNAGFLSLATGVFAGLTIGMVVQALYNRFKNIVLPTWIAFFQGVRFIPIITFISSIGLSLLFSMVWPLVSIGLFWMGTGLMHSYGVNSLVYGTFNRMLIPFGLHHVLNTTMWFTNVGGTFDANSANAFIKIDNVYYMILDPKTMAPVSWNLLSGGQIKGVIAGDINIFSAMTSLVGREVAIEPINGLTPTNDHVKLTMEMIIGGTAVGNYDADLGKYQIGLVTCNPGQYTSGAYITTMFGLPAAAGAMIMAAPKGENRKMSMSILLSSMICCFLTGITEPIEFTFLFLAPWLFYGFHAIMNGIAMMVANFCKIHLAFSFSASLLDYSIWGIPAEISGGQLNIWVIPCIGILYSVIYYLVFYFCIKKFDIATPGRGGNNKLFSKKDYLEAKKKNSSTNDVRDNAIEIIKAYGGLKNIKNVDACITKLRIQVIDQKKVDDNRLKEIGALGVTRPSSQSVYAVFGQMADRYKNEIIAITKEVSTNKTLEAKLTAKAKKVIKNDSNKMANKPKDTKKDVELTLVSPTNGKLINHSKIKDETFASQMMGKTLGIIPTNGTFCAPFDGKITMIAPTGHAFGMVNKAGQEILIHIGIDTVKINTNVKNQKDLKAFSILGKVDQNVKAGHPIIKANLSEIKNKYKLDTTTAIILLPSGNVAPIKFKENVNVKKGDSLLM